jgi:hypothetical protein
MHMYTSLGIKRRCSHLNEAESENGVRFSLFIDETCFVFISFCPFSDVDGI